MSVEINMDQVTTQTVQQLGGQIAMLTLELNAQMASRAALEKRITELEAETKEPELPGAFRAPDEVST